jgi:DNA-directed RNA polymerase specialized sigma subunit
MNKNEILDKQYWDEVLSGLDRKDDNSARRYRRYNKSLESMGDNILDTLIAKKDFSDDTYDEFESIMGFIESIDNERLYKGLKKLKPVELQMIIYRFDGNLKTADIVDRIGRGVSTVSERIQRILKKLIEEIDKK